MLTKNRIKLIKSLAFAKYRNSSGLFVAEGPKLVEELMQAYRCEILCATESWISRNKNLAAKADELATIDEQELRHISFLQTPQEVLGVYRQPADSDSSVTEILGTQLCLALDGVQNPGNVGTILRIADWFGIDHIVCSTDTADVYSPKVVQASMGAIARIKVVYRDLPAFLGTLPPETPVYGTFLNGDNIQQAHLNQHGLIIMGNEGNGIRPDVEKYVTKRLFIPSYPYGRATSESLNVAIATAITCEEFRRRI